MAEWAESTRFTYGCRGAHGGSSDIRFQSCACALLKHLDFTKTGLYTGLY